MLVDEVVETLDGVSGGNVAAGGVGQGGDGVADLAGGVAGDLEYLALGDEGAALEDGAAHPQVTAGEGEVPVASAPELRGDVLACSEINELSGDVGRGEVAAYLEAAAVI